MIPAKFKMRKILLTGATGYLGGRLLKKLEQSDFSLRCMVRQPNNLKSKVKQETEIVSGDVLKKETLLTALDGVDTAFYLIHSMQEGTQFEEQDRIGARNFAEAAKTAGVKRIIYLGGLGNDKEELSPHLKSRHEVGQILRESNALVIEFRASIVIGSGSLSYEMIRSLVERLPIMITPRWVRVLSQPIAINDLLNFLLKAINISPAESSIYEIGGKDQLSYKDIMNEYAWQRGLYRLMIPVPVLTPRLSGLWLGLVTPVYARIGQTLVKSIIHPTVVTNNKAEHVFDIETSGIKEAIKQAIEDEDAEFATTKWSYAVSSSGLTEKWGGVQFGTRLIDSRTAQSSAKPEYAFNPIATIGGQNGWYYGNFLWKLRGYLDLLVGGVGLRRGRRHPTHINVGDSLDFWRVEKYEVNKLLRLKAEMKLPGRAWLQFEVKENADGSTIRQTALFDPLGLSGLFYWYLLFPIHKLIFAGMLKEIKRKAEERF